MRLLDPNLQKNCSCTACCSCTASHSQPCTQQYVLAAARPPTHCLPADRIQTTLSQSFSHQVLPIPPAAWPPGWMCATASSTPTAATPISQQINSYPYFSRCFAGPGASSGYQRRFHAELSLWHTGTFVGEISPHCLFPPCSAPR